MNALNFTLLVAEDDEDDRLLMQDALAEANFEGRLIFVHDGEDLMEHLNDQREKSMPDLILLDLNMPRKDGREALREIKSDRDFRRIPLIVLTTSNDMDDIFQCYDSGANSFITKPPTFEGLVDALKTIIQFWVKLATGPEVKSSREAITSNLAKSALILHSQHSAAMI